MDGHTLYWGEIHNHNELGYGQGSLQRSYQIARSHLDFYAFTPHGLHADGGAPDGYPVVRQHWAEIQAAAREHYVPGEFTCFLAYEWHSNAWGHVHVVYLQDDDQPMQGAADLEALQEHFRGRDALLVPHHTAYINGVDWDRFDGALSPLVEIFSEHGASERDIGLHPMLGHSGGPGEARFTAQHGLALGHRFGFSAGTDNHDGYPGGYGLGLTGAWARENSRRGLAEAFRSRRTVAVTGDRIEVDFRSEGAPMGSVVAARAGREFSFRVQGWDFLSKVELLRDNVPVRVWTPDYTRAQGGERFRLRLEWGWGPMRGYQVFDWEGALSVQGGELVQVVPCFASDPFDEVRRKEVLERDGQGCRWRSHTSRGGVLTSRNGHAACRANDALCAEVVGDERTRVQVDMSCRTRTSLLSTSPDWSLSPRLGRGRWEHSLGELLEGRRGMRLEEVPTSVVLHRAAPPGGYALEGRWREQRGGSACYYLRVLQENGQMAWASPIWTEE